MPLYSASDMFGALTKAVNDEELRMGASVSSLTATNTELKAEVSELEDDVVLATETGKAAEKQVWNDALQAFVADSPGTDQFLKVFSDLVPQ